VTDAVTIETLTASAASSALPELVAVLADAEASGPSCQALGVSARASIAPCSPATTA